MANKVRRPHSSIPAVNESKLGTFIFVIFVFILCFIGYKVYTSESGLDDFFNKAEHI